MILAAQILQAQDTNVLRDVAVEANRRIKVVHCIDSFGAGGTELNMVRTIECLDWRRFEIILIVLNNAGVLRDRVNRTGIRIVSFPFPRLNSFSALWQAVRLVMWLRNLRPDVVHTHDRYTNLFVAPCARFAGVKLVITSRRWWTAMPRRFYGIGNQIAYRLSHRIIANSKRVARLMSESEGIPSSRIVVLPNFVSEDAFEPMPDETRRATLQAFGVPPDAFVIVAVAVFRPEKSLETLIEAVAILRQRHARLHLLLVGSGPTEDQLRHAAAVHGVAGRVHFPGFLPSSPNPHALGDISVLCSLHEGFPNSIIEAMAAGKPIVATNVGGIPDAVEDGTTGLLVPPQSADRLAAALDQLIADPALRLAFGAAGQRKSLREYGKATVMDTLSAIYAQGQPVSTPGPRDRLPDGA